MAFPAMKLRALQALVAVYEEQSFSLAAKRENTTQSGMSTQVKALEEMLGTPLLIRERGRMTLTPAGEIVYREGQRTLRSLLAAEKAVRELDNRVAGRVRVGIIPTLTRAVLSPAMTQFRADYPHVELSFLEEYSHSLMRRVLDGALDFALVPSTDLPSGLKGRFIGQDHEMLVSDAARATGWAHMAPVPLKALSGARLIVPSALNVRRRQIDLLLNTHGIELAERLEIDGMLATLEMLGSSDWVAILPSAICYPDRAGRVRRLNPIAEPPISLDYILVEKTEVPPPRAARLVAECLQTHIARVLDGWQGAGG